MPQKSTHITNLYAHTHFSEQSEGTQADHPEESKPKKRKSKVKQDQEILSKKEKMQEDAAATVLAKLDASHATSNTTPSSVTAVVTPSPLPLPTINTNSTPPVLSAAIPHIPPPDRKPAPVNNPTTASTTIVQPANGHLSTIRQSADYSKNLGMVFLILIVNMCLVGRHTFLTSISDVFSFLSCGQSCK